MRKSQGSQGPPSQAISQGVIATYQPSTVNPSPINDGCLEDAVGSVDEEGSVVGSESSDSDEDFIFKESEDEDDDLFVDNVDNDVVDEVFPDLGGGEFVYEDNEQELDYSEELKSMSGSDSDAKAHIRYPEFNPLVDFNKPICLKVDMRFGDNQIFRRALKQFTIEKGGDFYYLHNDGNKVSTYCKLKCDCPLTHGRKKCVCNVSLCGFKACARRMGSDGTFQLKSFVPKHDCGWQHENTKVTSIWLAEKYIEHYMDEPQWKLSSFISAVQRDYVVEISNYQAWATRLRANLMTQGDAREQYGRVWDYAETVQKWNPGSSTYVKVCLNNPQKPLFQRLYICLDACKMRCRPIIGLDGCHLKGAYTGQMLVAVGNDGNENIFPIAWDVVEAERKETWAWFLDILMRDIGSTNPTFMSDRQKGLIEALNDVVPLDDTRVCVRHLYNNFKVKWPGKNFKDILWAAARASTRVEFDLTMEEIKKMDEDAYTYLIRANPKSWSRHAFKFYTNSDMLLNNVCESFNSYILRARDKPTLSMCEWIRRQLMKRFVAKRDGMTKHSGILTPNTIKRIEVAKEEGLKMCRCIWGGGTRYEVDHQWRTYVVDLAQRSCGCHKWDIIGIPCCHALSCIMKARLNVEDFVSSYYSKETYMNAYSNLVQPMPGSKEWEVTKHTPPEPPRYIVQPGRPKRARRKEPGENKEKAKRVRLFRPKCSHCGNGHYKNKCVNPQKAPEPAKESQSRGGRPKNPKTIHIGTKKRKTVKKVPRVVATSTSNPQSSGHEGLSGTQASSTSQVLNQQIWNP